MEEGSRRERMKEYIDASVFLGMHSKDERTRVACKNYFVQRPNEEIGMSLEQVGKCDDVIWQFPRERQDAYYPFMDNLHTIMRIDRISYDREDISAATFNQHLHGLDISDRLTMGLVLARRGVLYTINPTLVNLRPGKLKDRLGGEVVLTREQADLTDIARFPYTRSPEAGKELVFPTELELLYQQSLAVRI